MTSDSLGDVVEQTTTSAVWYRANPFNDEPVDGRVDPGSASSDAISGGGGIGSVPPAMSPSTLPVLSNLRQRLHLVPTPDPTSPDLGGLSPPPRS